MATPAGHALCGVLVGTLAAWQRPLLGPWKDVVLFAALAQAPDLDFLPGLLVGRVDAFHHGISHSMGFALIFGLILAWVGKRQGQALRWGVIGAAIYLTQVVVDALAVDTRPPYGVPLWWPLSGTYVQSGSPIFLDVRRGNLNWPTIAHNLRALGREILLLGLPAALVLWIRRKYLAGGRSLIRKG
jgi:inner membrane protein